MVRRFMWEIVVGFLLISLSAGLFVTETSYFNNTRDTLVYFLQSLAFLPLQVLLVTLIIDQLLIHREKQDKLRKLNMVINVFFTEIGSSLLRIFLEFDNMPDNIMTELRVSDEWDKKRFLSAMLTSRAHKNHINVDTEKLEKLRQFLLVKRDFLLLMLENPTLLEHDSFTNLLMAVFHVVDELSHRQDISSLPDTDYTHLEGDIQRAYKLLVVEWLSYMKHLKEDYPYLFSLAVRISPFDINASAIVKEG